MGKAHWTLLPESPAPSVCWGWSWAEGRPQEGQSCDPGQAWTGPQSPEQRRVQAPVSEVWLAQKPLCPHMEKSEGAGTAASL